VAGETAFHGGGKKRPPAAVAADGCECMAGKKSLLPGALLVAVQAQLLPTFVFVDFCLAAFFQRTHIKKQLQIPAALPIQFFARPSVISRWRSRDTR
jgi:hypothetical protein